MPLFPSSLTLADSFHPLNTSPFCFWPHIYYVLFSSFPKNLFPLTIYFLVLWPVHIDTQIHTNVLHIYAHIILNLGSTWVKISLLSKPDWLLVTKYFPILSIFFYKWCSFIFFVKYSSVVYMYHIFFIYSFIGGYLGWFPFLVIVNSAAVNTNV